MRVAFLGNFGPPHSTENHLRGSLESMGHLVTLLQEGEVRATDVPRLVKEAEADLFVWTQTYGLAVSGGTIEERARMVEDVRSLGVPSLSVHLDRWWGLDRADQLASEPFFRTDLVATADGGHDEQWKALGVNHVWSPPGVYHAECEPGSARSPYRADIAFVGSWANYGHREWRHRHDLVAHLQRRWRRQTALWPRRGHGAVRGEALRDLYASVLVVVGDSCLVPGVGGGPAMRYCSDRIPETLGRGGFLLHPRVEGVTDGTLWTEGEHLACWDLGNWAELDDKIRYYLAHEDERRAIAAAGRVHTLAHHTYRHRMERLLELVA